MVSQRAREIVVYLQPCQVATPPAIEQRMSKVVMSAVIDIKILLFELSPVFWFKLSGKPRDRELGAYARCIGLARAV